MPQAPSSDFLPVLNLVLMFGQKVKSVFVRHHLISEPKQKLKAKRYLAANSFLQPLPMGDLFCLQTALGFASLVIHHQLHAEFSQLDVPS